MSQFYQDIQLDTTLVTTPLDEDHLGQKISEGLTLSDENDSSIDVRTPSLHHEDSSSAPCNDHSESKTILKRPLTYDQGLEEVVKNLENKFKHKLDLYEKLGKSCPSFASFEIAVNEGKGAKLSRSNTYHIFNIAELYDAWSENMTFLTKRKKSEKHWQAGLKKWLDGQWRKDKNPFDLVLKEQKVQEANQIRSLITALFIVKDEILGVVKAPVIVQHHHHYYCKCGSPSVSQMEKISEKQSQPSNNEIHHHIHYVDGQINSVPLEITQPKIKSEPTPNVKNETDEMDFEVSVKETPKLESSRKRKEKKNAKKRIRESNSPLGGRKRPNREEKDLQMMSVNLSEQSSEQTTQSNEWNCELPNVHWQMPEVNLPMQWQPPQIPQMQYQMPHVQMPQVQVPWHFPHVNFDNGVPWPFSEINIPTHFQFPEVQLPTGIGNFFKKENRQI